MGKRDSTVDKVVKKKTCDNGRDSCEAISAGFFLMKIDFMISYNNLESAMETRDHFKNGASLKSQISRLKFTILMMLMLFVSSCEKEESKNDQQNPLFPLNIGNSWTYENTTKYGTTTTQRSVLYSYTINGITGFALEEYEKGEPISLFKNDKDGNLVEYLFNNDNFIHSTILYKKNVKRGDSWIYKAAVYTDDDYSEYEIEERIMTCITSDTIITTSLGDFHCIAFSYHPGGTQENGDPNHTMINFLSENVGPIKIVHYEHDRGNTWLFSEEILTDYSLK